MTSSDGQGRPKILLLFPLPDRDIQMSLAREAELVEPPTRDEEALVRSIQDVDAVITRGVGAQISRSVMEAAQRLKVICAIGSGTDNIDMAAAEALGIKVLSGAGVGPRAVAEYVIGAMVAAHRGFMNLHHAVASSSVDWPTRVERFSSIELTGQTLGIIGFGYIGRELARLSRLVFDSHILVFDPYATPISDSEVEFISDLHELLERSLTVSVHTPLLRSTRSLLGYEELVRIGPSGVLINAARGGIVDEDALINVLETNQLKAAVLDVYADEPPTPERARLLGQVPNLLLTPHIAGVTDQALKALSLNAAQGVLNALEEPMESLREQG